MVCWAMGNYCTDVIEFVYDTYKKRLQYCKHVAMQEYGILWEIGINVAK